MLSAFPGFWTDKPPVTKGFPSQRVSDAGSWSYICLPAWRNCKTSWFVYPHSAASMRLKLPNALHWRHNECDGISNHWGHDYLLVCSGTDQRKHHSSMSLAFERGIHQWPVNALHKGWITQKMFPFDDVIMDRPSDSQISQNNHSKTQ